MKIKAFRDVDPTDRELLYAGRYLLHLAQDVADISAKDHAGWRKWAQKRVRRELQLD